MILDTKITNKEKIAVVDDVVKGTDWEVRGQYFYDRQAKELNSMAHCQQDILDRARVTAARLGLPIRPTIFHAQPDATPADEQKGEEDSSPKETSSSSYTPCTTQFLRLEQEKRGVLQIHQAPCPI